MEIHPPHSAPHSLREILLQLAIVTIGILIALSLEGTVTWWHHRVLVRETRERIHAELRGDQESIRSVLKTADEGLKRLKRGIEFADGLSQPDGRGAEGRAVCSQGNGNVLYGLTFAWLNTASFVAAQGNGALGLMGYDESLRYADAYDLQNVYIRMQDA